MIYAGIDAGGTSCKCVVVNEKNQILAKVKTGPANYQVVGIEQAVLEIRKSIELASKKADIDFIDTLGVGMAGAGSENDLKKIKSRLLPLDKAKKAYLTNDGEIAVLGAHAGKAGVVLISGTGSIVYGLTKNFKTIRAGGWGPFLGDEGSGFWIGLQALKSIIKAKEERGRKTFLEKAVLDYLKLDNLRELVDFIYQIPLPRERIASITPIVIKEMLKKDQVAKDIIDKGLVELALTVKVVVDKISKGSDNIINTDIFDIAVMGGLFSNDYIYRLFSEKIGSKYGFKIFKPQYNAVYGAVFYGAIKSGDTDILDYIKKSIKLNS